MQTSFTVSVAPTSKHPTSPASVVRVGDGGRGFTIEQRISTAALMPKRSGKLRLRRFVEHRLIVTAAHCLPKIPPVQPTFYYERTYKSLLGALDGGNKGVWAECLFVDPIGDVAILGSPMSKRGATRTSTM
jgi:hypothetical protein